MFKKIKKLKNIRVIILSLTLFAIITASVMAYRSKDVLATSCCVSLCECTLETVPDDLTLWLQNWVEINVYIASNLLAHREGWFDTVYWERHMLPFFMKIGVHLAAAGTQQVSIIGMFIDADQQLETQRLIQELHAEANKDYHPSRGMCEFGTRIKSLAASERKGEMNALILSERSTDRYLGNKETGAASGSEGDVQMRLDQFEKKFCDTFDNNNSLRFMCPDLAPASNPSTAQRDRLNKDIDYQRTFEDPWTIDFDLTAGNPPSEGDEEIIALKDNLYGFESFNRADYKKIENKTNGDITDLQQAYMDMRAVIAKTKVAENSFNAIMALKGEGTAGSRDFIASYLEELGIPDSEVDEFLGTNPSYYAQMEVLTKKAYQSPLFYTNLYDKPANIERKGVAIQAIGLIQKFDLLKSYLRTEASLSILLELSVNQLQREVENNIQALTDSEK